MDLRPQIIHPFTSGGLPVSEVEPLAPEKLWLDFLAVMSSGDLQKVTECPRLGLFEISVRRLCDLGYMKDPKRYQNQGKLVWSASWVPPYSLRSFLDSLKIQYHVFVRSMADYAQSQVLQPLVGFDVDGRSATISGVIAVAHFAGENGCLSWFVNAKDRTKFVRTTRAFDRANGIF